MKNQQAALTEHLEKSGEDEMWGGAGQVGREREIGVGFKGLFSLLFRIVRASARLLSSPSTRASA